MKAVLKYFILLIFLVYLVSCTKDDASSITLSVPELTLKVGQSDTLTATISCTGEVELVTVNVAIADSNLAVAKVLPDKKISSADGSTFTQTIVVKALAAGNTIVVLSAGSKKLNCNLTTTQTTLIYTQSVMLNYGLAIESTDSKLMDIYLFPATFNVDTVNKTYTGQGKFIRIETFIPPTKSTLVAGEYSENSYGAEYSFMPGETYTENKQTYLYGTYITEYSGTESTYILIKSGKYKVTTEGGRCSIEGEMTTETDEIIRFSYSGVASVIDNTEKSREIMPQFTKGALYAVGDYFHCNKSNSIFAYIQTSDVNLNESSINGELMVIQFNISLSYTYSVPPGIYNMLTSAQFAEYRVFPYTLDPGFVYMNPIKPSIEGCWYYDHDTGKRLVSGSVTVNTETIATKGYYTLDYSFYTRIGSLVHGTCTFPGAVGAFAPASKIQATGTDDEDAKLSRFLPLNKNLASPTAKRIFPVAGMRKL